MSEIEDAELDAMKAVKNAIADLEPNVALRVVRWAYERTKERVGAGGSTKALPSLESVPTISGASTVTEPAQFPDLPALYHAANPSTEAERALVGAYWAQVREGAESFNSYGINTKLKNMGYQIANVTKAFDALLNDSPRLVIQVSKGDSAQSRKKLRLTTEGIRKVERMLQQQNAEA